jgi:hypothetical protein
MKIAKMVQLIEPQLGGEPVLAATKAVPRGAMHEVILSAAGAAVGGATTPVAAAPGAVLGGRAGAPTGEAGRSERSHAGVDVGHANQVLLVVTERRVALFALSAFGRPKDLTAEIDRNRLAAVYMGETSLLGQKMAEIQVVLDSGHEVGFGVAKVHRRSGDSVVAALG